MCLCVCVYIVRSLLLNLQLTLATSVFLNLSKFFF